MYASNTVSPSTNFISRNIQSTVSQADNNFLTARPDMLEIKADVGDMNANGAPGPDGFSGTFFTSFWDTVGTDVINSVQFFFQNGWLIPNANPSHVIIIPKDPGADVIEKFRPIAMGNFHFKITVGYGFCEKFVGWIRTILHSARMSIVVNEKAMDYFGCIRGVHRGDPVSPILFCLAEDVLICAISNAFKQGLVHHISSPRGTISPSHVLYADDIMVFYRGTKRDVQALMNIFEEYGNNSGQFISAAKCTIYSSKHISDRISNIIASYNIPMGTLPFCYLGVPFFSRWPISCIKTHEKWIHNFVWSGDINTIHHNSVAWDKVFLPENQGGLGIKSMKSLDNDFLMKMTWKTMIEN
ncbi:uncharacterized protein LOC113305700 [Papaver somniferum]|uniref:uncharacterized protein LOC113305700 n=1 Tax=Papaver somniferum TaxID=3469 RepID=UPI000E6F7C0D|nr:uncharacterized protein LOC113305700 [Papaver somniferum]